jgi:hypothetical protein
MPTLLFHYPEKEKRWTVEVEQDRFTIGRSRDADVCVPHSSVSKKHLLIERRGPRYFFQDLRSKNGIYLNEFRKERGTLTDGDEIRLGSIRVKFYRARPPARVHQPGEAPPAPGTPLEEPGPDGSASGGGGPDGTAGNETLAMPAEALPEAPSPVDLDPETLEDVPPLDVDLEMPSDGDGEVIALDGSEVVEAAHDDAVDVEAPAPRHRRPAAPRETTASDASREMVPPRRISPAVLVAAAAGCVALGLFLGHLGSLLEDSPPSEEPATAASAPDAPPPAATAREPATGGPPAAATAETIIGPHADLGDPETRARLIVRLHLDLLDRPPTREEIAEMSKLEKHDRLWHDIVTRAGFRADADPGKVCSLLLGRKPAAAELEALLVAAERDMDRLAFMVGTSREYASPGHRRKRSMLQLTRSLIVNILDLLPGREASSKVLGEIEDAKGAVERVARGLVVLEESRAGPGQGEAPERWLEGAYDRLLLRRPSAEERQRGLAAIAAAKDGWREVLAELAARDEYLEY